MAFSVPGQGAYSPAPLTPGRVASGAGSDHGQGIEGARDEEARSGAQGSHKGQLQVIYPLCLTFILFIMNFFHFRRVSCEKRRDEAAAAAREKELDALAREARLEALRRFTRRRMGLGMRLDVCEYRVRDFDIYIYIVQYLRVTFELWGSNLRVYDLRKAYFT